MMGSLVAAYGSTSGGMSGGSWALVIAIAAVVIAAGVWLFLRMRNRREQGPSPQHPASG
jgi:hypothetical protein